MIGMYFYEADTQSWNYCEWCGGNKYCSVVTGKVYINGVNIEQ